MADDELATGRVRVVDSEGDAATDVREEFFPGMTDDEVSEAVKAANAKLPTSRWYVR